MGKKYNNKYLCALFVPGRALMTFMCCMSRPRRNKQLHFDFDFLKSLSHHSSLTHFIFILAFFKQLILL